MNKTLLVHLALFLSLFFLSPSARAQGVYNRAKAQARKVAPSPYPTPPPRNGSSPAAPATAPRPAPSSAAGYAPSPTPPPATPRHAAASPVRAKELSEDVVQRTVEFQKKRAEEGSATAQHDLGVRYLKGEGVEKDEAAGLKWLQAAAKNGHDQAVKKLKELDELKQNGAAATGLLRPQ